MLFNLVPWQELLQLIIANDLNLVDFVRGPETIHEMQKGNPRVEGGDLANGRHVVGLLYRKTTEHTQTTTTDKHGITMISINGKGFSCQGTRGDVDDCRQQFAGNLVNVGNKEQQTLRGCKGRCQGSRNEGSMQGTGCKVEVLVVGR